MQSRRYAYSEFSKSFKISLDTRKPGEKLSTASFPGFLAIYTEGYSARFIHTYVKNPDNFILHSAARTGKLNFLNLAISQYSWGAALKVNSDTQLRMLAL